MRAMADRTAGHALIVLCTMMIGDDRMPNDVAAGAFDRRADLIAKHGQPGDEWAAREALWQRRDYEARMESRAVFAGLDRGWDGEGVRPSWLASINAGACESLGLRLEVEP